MIDVEALGLEEKVGDVAFLNEIQAGVNKWIKEIQKVTRLVRYDYVSRHSSEQYENAHIH